MESFKSALSAYRKVSQKINTHVEAVLSEANTYTPGGQASEPTVREIAQDAINHFSHPEHELVKRHYFGPSFRCDMCWEALSGPAFGCVAGCDFAIHDSCAAHPQTHYCPAHPPHSLVLLQTRRDVAHTCDFCAGRCAPGSFLYRCPPCWFDMHPRCTALPLAAVRSARHPEHDLTLVVAEEGIRCAACRLGAGSPWYSYRCTTCNIDFHVSCATGGEDNSVGAHHDAAARSHVPPVAVANSHVQPVAAGNSHVPAAAGAAHSHVPASAVQSHAQQQAEAAQMQAVARQLQAELLRARIQAQGDMVYANTMRNAGLDMMSLFYPMERRRDY